jgi:peptidoglycan/xylan/chitin deacetylase (PgdA/CDA1 family)
MLTLTESLPREHANSADLRTLPVSIVLDNGDECALTTGATTTVDVDGQRQRVNYFCRSGGVLIGEPNTGDVIWTIHYSPDARGLGTLRRAGIARAFAFRGDTGSVGWSAPGDTAAPLQDVRLETLPGAQRLVFDFGDGPLPAYEVGYVNESPVNAAGEPIDIDADRWLRVWFTYPEGAAETNTFQSDMIQMPDGDNFNGLALGRAPRGSLMWWAGLDRVSGFEVTRDEAAAEIIVDIFAPPPGQAERPLIGVGSRGENVRLLRQRLIAAGYLQGDTSRDDFDQELLRAIAEFQAAHGQIPNGVAGPAVWAALERPLPPPRNDTSARHTVYARLALSQGDDLMATPNDIYEVYVRSGPGLDYPVIDSLLPGQSLPVTGQVEGTSPETSWWEVCCVNGQSGWVRADVVNVSGPLVEADPATPPDAPPATGIRPQQRPLQTTAGNPILYFTFDDGPWDTYTEAIAATMAENGGRATFFAIGRQVSWTPEIAASLVPAHSVQNHTYNHASLDGISRSAFFSEVEQTQVVIQQTTGQLPTCLRPPYGATDGATTQMAAELGLDVVLWTVDTQDWMRPGVEAIVAEIMNHAAPGAIILMHDGGGERDQTLEALRIALPQLRAQGYVFEALCG